MEFRFVYTGIRVRELERAVAFYTGALGMREVRRKGNPSTGGTYVLLKTPGGQQVLELNHYGDGGGAGHKEPPYTTPGDALDHLAFLVGDVDAAYHELVAKGALPMLPPFDSNGERIAFVTDPDGTPIELFAEWSGDGG